MHGSGPHHASAAPSPRRSRTIFHGHVVRHTDFLFLDRISDSQSPPSLTLYHRLFFVAFCSRALVSRPAQGSGCAPVQSAVDRTGLWSIVRRQRDGSNGGTEPSSRLPSESGRRLSAQSTQAPEDSVRRRDDPPSAPAAGRRGDCCVGSCPSAGGGPTWLMV